METIHPIIVHFPIALLLTSTFISLLAVLFKNKREELKIVLYWILILGSISVLAALASGLYEDERVIHDNAIHQIMEVHKLLGFIITSAFVSITLWFIIRKRKIRYRELWIITLFLIVTSAVLVYSAYLGGKMVYEQGAGVKPMEKYIMEMPGGSMYHSGGEAPHNADENMKRLHKHMHSTYQEMTKDSVARNTGSTSKKKAVQNTSDHSHGPHLN